MNIQRQQSEFLTIAYTCAYTWATLSLAGADHAPVRAEEGMEEDIYRYDPTGKRDPFLSPFHSAPVPVVPEPMVPKEDKPSLQRFDLGQMRLMGVVLVAGESQALIEDGEGVKHLVTSGMLIGSKGGVIKAIESERIVVEEYEIDVHGQRRAKEREIPLSVIRSPIEGKRKKAK